jgi:hypothetical protein
LALSERQFLFEGGFDGFMKELLSIAESASSQFSEPLLQPEAWLYQAIAKNNTKGSSSSDDSESSGDNKLIFLAASLRSLEAILPFVSHDALLARGDLLFGSLESLVLKAENEDVVESASSAIVTLLELLSLRDPEKDHEDVTLVCERLDELANAEFKNSQATYDNRQRWEKRKLALEEAAKGKVFQVALPWIKLSRIDRSSWSQRLVPENIRAKTDTLEVPWSLAAPLRFMHDLIGSEFNDQVRKEDSPLNQSFFGLIDEFDAWALPRLRFEQTGASIFTRYIDDMQWASKIAGKKDRKYDLVGPQIHGSF